MIEGGTLCQTRRTRVQPWKSGASAPRRVEQMHAGFSPCGTSVQRLILSARKGTDAVIEFKLPELGENIEQGDLVRLMVAPGTSVSAGQSVMELETDKAVVEVPSSVSGTVQEIRVKEGDKIKVGQVIFTVDGTEAKSAAATSQGAAPASPQKAEAPVPSSENVPQPAASAAPAPAAAPAPSA